MMQVIILFLLNSFTSQHQSSNLIMISMINLLFFFLCYTLQESKLNPSAKVFSPSFPNLRSTPPLVQTAPSVAYVTNSIPAAEVAGAQPEVEMQPIVPRTSWPVKFFPYVTSTAVTAENGLQYTQPVCIIRFA